MSMFTNYDKNSTTCPRTTVRECHSNRVPYAEYNANNELIGYYWYYGDTVDIQFDVTGEVTIESDAIVYTASGDMPQENTVGYINQKAYNIVDYISWTCVAIVEGKYIWEEDKIFEAPANDGRLLYISAKNFLKDMLYKICIYNDRYELLYTFDGNASTNILLHIDEDLSKELVKGIYYITLTVSNKNSTNFIPLIKDKECILLVK